MNFDRLWFFLPILKTTDCNNFSSLITVFLWRKWKWGEKVGMHWNIQMSSLHYSLLATFMPSHLGDGHWSFLWASNHALYLLRPADTDYMSFTPMWWKKPTWICKKTKDNRWECDLHAVLTDGALANVTDLWRVVVLSLDRHRLTRSPDNSQQPILGRDLLYDCRTCHSSRQCPRCARCRCHHVPGSRTAGGEFHSNVQ